MFHADHTSGPAARQYPDPVALCPEGARPGDNSGRYLLLRVPVGLLPAVRKALMIGRNAAMMCREDEVRAGLEALRLEVEACIPGLAAIFQAGLWAAIAGRATGGLPLVVEVVNAGRGWVPEWRVAVRDPSGTRWPGTPDSEVPALSETLETEAEARRLATALEELLTRLAPLD